MTSNFFLLLVAVAFFAVACTKKESPSIPPSPTPLPPSPPTVSLFILAGQSNMLGESDLWPFPHEPGVVDLFGEEKGPGYIFGKLFHQSTGQGVILVQCAVGSTSIWDWQPGDKLYSALLSKVKEARSAFPGAEISGVLFFQGEQDGVKTASTPWVQIFTSLVVQLRKDFSNLALPVVFAQIGPALPGAPSWKDIQDQQSSIALPNTIMIRTDDLTYRDGLHFDRSSYEEIGRRFFDAYQKVKP